MTASLAHGFEPDFNLLDASRCCSFRRTPRSKQPVPWRHLPPILFSPNAGEVQEQYIERLQQRLRDIDSADELYPPDMRAAGQVTQMQLEHDPRTDAEVKKLFPNLGGRRFRMLRGGFGLVDINYLVSIVASDEARETILGSAPLGPQFNHANETVILADVYFNRALLWRASRVIINDRRHVQAELERSLAALSKQTIHPPSDSQ